MATKTASTATLRTIPTDLRRALASDRAARAAWEGLTPLARNEWICWVTIVKTPQTRREHIARLREDLRNGKRRPCCWPGCPHRRPKARKWFRQPTREGTG